MDVQEAEPDEYLSREFDYPVYVHLKGASLYQHKKNNNYAREDFHAHAENYKCLFSPYISQTDILMNGVYWDTNIPRLFTMDDLKRTDWRIQTIADITDDAGGSIPCNLGDCTMNDPVYGVDKLTGNKTKSYIITSVDVMAVGNLPNELPRDASRFFGEQLIKYILKDVINGNSIIVNNATILKNGKLTQPFEYLHDYAHD